MRDIRVPQAVRVQHRVESEVVAPVGESVVDVIETDAALPFGRPQDRLVSEAEARPNLGDVFLDHRASPPEHRQHRPTPRLRAAHRLAPPDVADPEPAELRPLRVPGEVEEVEHRRFTPTQPERVHRLEQGRVAKQRQPALATGRAGTIHEIIGIVEERLQLDPRQRAHRRTSLVIADMDNGVPLVADLHRMRVEQLHAAIHPAVAVVKQVVAEQRDRVLMRPHRRDRQRPRSRDECSCPFLDIGRRPLPRRGVAEVREPAHLGRSGLDSLPRQHPRGLLRRPPRQHLIEELLRRTQQRHIARGQRSTRTGPLIIGEHHAMTLH